MLVRIQVIVLNLDKNTGMFFLVFDLDLVTEPGLKNRKSMGTNSCSFFANAPILVISILKTILEKKGPNLQPATKIAKENLFLFLVQAPRVRFLACSLESHLKLQSDANVGWALSHPHNTSDEVCLWDQETSKCRSISISIFQHQSTCKLLTVLISTFCCLFIVIVV